MTNTSLLNVAVTAGNIKAIYHMADIKNTYCMTFIYYYYPLMFLKEQS